MFDCLRATDNRGVENDFVLYFPRESVRFFDKTVYTRTGRSLWILPEPLERDIEPVHLVFRFAKMIEQTCRQILVASFFDHFWKGFYNLIFSVVNVLQSMEEKILHGFDFFCE